VIAWYIHFDTDQHEERWGGGAPSTALSFIIKIKERKKKQELYFFAFRVVSEFRIISTQPTTAAKLKLKPPA
jgi:hypothetical protein